MTDLTIYPVGSVQSNKQVHVSIYYIYGSLASDYSINQLHESI